SRTLAISIIALFVMGASDMITIVVRQTLVQMKTPPAVRGRVNALNQLFVDTGNHLGALESGLTATWFGVVPSVVIGGIGTLLVVGLWSRMFPELVRVDRLEAEAPG